MIKGIIIKNTDWDRMIQALVLIKLGQDLGTDGPFAKAVHDMIEIVITIITATAKL